MYPHERSLVKKLADKPFAIIGVNSDKELETIREVVKKKDITWRSFWNGEHGTNGPISNAWQVSGWPTIYVLDAEGRIQYKGNAGPELDQTVVTLLADMGHEVDISDDDDEGDADDAEGGENKDESEEAGEEDKEGSN